MYRECDNKLIFLFIYIKSCQIERLAAIAAEAKQQQATLTKQREEYVKKSAALQRELEILRQQCDEIGKEGGRENNRIIKENQKLQVCGIFRNFLSRT